MTTEQPASVRIGCTEVERRIGEGIASALRELLDDGDLTKLAELDAGNILTMAWAVEAAIGSDRMRGELVIFHDCGADDVHDASGSLTDWAARIGWKNDD